MTEYNKAELTCIFHAWAEQYAAQYAADPDSFEDIMSDNGSIVEGYASNSADKFIEIAEDLNERGII